MSQDKVQKSLLQTRNIYIEFGGGSAAKSLADRDEFVRVFRGAARRMRYIGMMTESTLITTVVNREWKQLSSPFYAYVTQLEYKALSRALRLAYFDPAQPEYGNQDAGTGKGNDRYQRFMAICRRGKKLMVNGLDAHAMKRVASYQRPQGHTRMEDVIAESCEAERHMNYYYNSAGEKVFVGTVDKGEDK
jgi:hypothetical protein